MDVLPDILKIEMLTDKEKEVLDAITNDVRILNAACLRLSDDAKKNQINEIYRRLSDLTSDVCDRLGTEVSLDFASPQIHEIFEVLHTLGDKIEVESGVIDTPLRPAESERILKGIGRIRGNKKN